MAIHTGTDTSNASWSAFHASCDEPSNPTVTKTATSCLLPLFQEDAATVAMIRHSLDVNYQEGY